MSPLPRRVWDAFRSHRSDLPRRPSPSPTRGEAENTPAFSRRAFAPELCPRPNKQTTAERDLRQTAPVVGPAKSRSRAEVSRHCEERSDEAIQTLCRRPWIRFVASLLAMTKKGKRNAERRCSTTTASCDAARARPGALASRRPTTALAAATERHRSARATRLPATCSERPPRWFERRSASQHTTRRPENGLPCVTRGRYPRLAVPVQRDCTRSPVMMPSGRVLPKPPESRGDEP